MATSTYPTVEEMKPLSAQAYQAVRESLFHHKAQYSGTSRKFGVRPVLAFARWLDNIFITSDVACVTDVVTFRC